MLFKIKNPWPELYTKFNDRFFKEAPKNYVERFPELFKDFDWWKPVIHAESPLWRPVRPFLFKYDRAFFHMIKSGEIEELFNFRGYLEDYNLLMEVHFILVVLYAFITICGPDSD